MCLINTGTCICAAGWSGEFCTKKCEEGTYGFNCSQKCDCAVDKNVLACDSAVGTCFCKPDDLRGGYLFYLQERNANIKNKIRKI